MILGATGKNFGAGMSGGVAYVYDKDDRLKRLVNEDVAGDLLRIDSKEVSRLFCCHAGVQSVLQQVHMFHCSQKTCTRRRVHRLAPVTAPVIMQQRYCVCSPVVAGRRASASASVHVRVSDSSPILSLLQRRDRTRAR